MEITVSDIQLHRLTKRYTYFKCLHQYDLDIWKTYWQQEQIVYFDFSFPGASKFFLYIIKLLMAPILKCPEISPQHYLDFFKIVDFLGTPKLQFKYEIYLFIKNFQNSVHYLDAFIRHNSNVRTWKVIHLEQMIQALYIKKFSILPPTLTHPEYFHDYTMANFTIDYRTQNFSTKFDCVYCMQNLYPLELFFIVK